MNEHLHGHDAHNHGTTAVVEPTPVETPETEISDGVAIKTENSEYRVYATVDADGNASNYELVNVDDFDAWEKKPSNTGKQVAFSQTVRLYKAGSIEGFVKLISDDEEAINIINRGLAQKTSQKIRALFLAEDETKKLTFDVTDSVFDTRELLQEATKRKSLSPIEKLGREAKKAGFDPALIAQLLAQLQQASAS